jgi:protein-S-isoprenylcysteine O-methyltransferase Ste14
MRNEITRFALVILFIICLFSNSALEKNWNWICEGLDLLGSILLGIGVLGRVWCLAYICGHKNDRVVREGPYSMCRNPLYFFSFIAALGIACATEMVIFPLTVLIFFGLYYPHTIKQEETRLLAKHNLEYQDYMRTVPRFFPKLSLLSESTNYSMNPKIFRKQLSGAIWFIWFFGMVQGTESLHQLGWVPVYFHLY